jgi:O-6-methylguanine DNA methyltransferase
MAYTEIAMPAGDILIAGTDDGISALIIVAHAKMPAALDTLSAYCQGVPLVPDADALADVTTQLMEYLDGTRQKFDVPLALIGTPFQRRVWEALLAIPYGETLTYWEIAHALDKPGGSQAVGGAVARNPVSIIVPCHRVLGSDGSLTGYMWGTHVKRWLLDHERRHSGRTGVSSGQQYMLPI